MTDAPPPKLTGSRNQCRACGEYFNSNTAFTLHRVGTIGTPDRRCKTPDELAAAGWVQNRYGFWTTGAMPTFFKGGAAATHEEDMDDEH